MGADSLTTLVADALISLRNAIIAVNVVAGVFLLGVLVQAVRERRRQPVEAPNQVPYLDDPQMEGPRLERILGWTLAMFAIIAVSLPAYWLLEPERQELRSDAFLETSVEQGEELYASTTSGSEVALGCADCHGPEGQGGFATQVVNIPRDEVETTDEAFASEDRVCAPAPDDETTLICSVSWRAPALDTVFLRFSREEVEEIVTYGRPGTPMPAWGLEGGGAKNEQSIDNIVDFLESLQVGADEAKARQAGVTDGQALFEANCARCHTKHWSYAGTFAQSEAFDVFAVPGGGAFGPNLTGDVTERQFPAVQDHIDFIRDGSDFQAPYGTRGIGSGRMPGFGQVLTDEQIEAIVQYERDLEDERTRLDNLVETDGGDETDGGTDDSDGDGDGDGDESEVETASEEGDES